MPQLDVLYEDNHLLVVNKSPGLATMGTRDDVPSLVHAAKAYVKRKYRKPGNVYLGVVSRLDAWASGAVVLARTSKAAARLSEQLRSRSVRKVYWALVPRAIDPPVGEWIDELAKDETAQRMVVVPQGDGQRAVLRYRVLSPAGNAWLVEIELHSGRKHQIRVQFASRGLPILGDRKYGSRQPFSPQTIALHSLRLEFEHPVRREPVVFTAPPPAVWREYGVGQ